MNIDKQTGVSVVMATYNGELYLQRQLESIARQTRLPDELIISDDGSSDNTISIVKEFSLSVSFPVIVRINPTRLGYGENFISAAKMARSEFVAFCDQDDIWADDKLNRAVGLLMKEGAALHVHTATVIDENDQKIGQFDQGIRHTAVIPPLTLPPWGVYYGFSMTFRRDLLSLIDPDDRGRHTFEYEGQLSHDLWLYFVATSLDRVIVDRKPLAYYRRHGKNETPNLKGKLLQTLSVKLGTAANPKLRRDIIAAHRAELIGALSSQSDSRLSQDVVRRASVFWTGIASYERSRINLYQQNNSMERVNSLFALLIKGAYRKPISGGLGFRLLCKDILFGCARVGSR